MIIASYSGSTKSSICSGLHQPSWHRRGRLVATGGGSRHALSVCRHYVATMNLPLCVRRDSGPDGSTMPMRRRLVVPSWALPRTDTQPSSECLPRLGFLRTAAAPAKTAFLRSMSAQPLGHHSGVDPGVLARFRRAELLRWLGIPVHTAPLKAASAASPRCTPPAPACAAPFPEAAS